MAKLDKRVQGARDWMKKHEAEGTDLSKLGTALGAWDGAVKAVEEAKAKLETAKGDTKVAAKAVFEARKASKAPKVAKVPKEPKAPKPAKS